MLNWVTIIVLIAAAFLVLELFKHIFMRKFSKWVIVLIILFIFLFALSSFIELPTQLKDSDNKFVATGAAIFSDINEAVTENMKEANFTNPLNEDP